MPILGIGPPYPTVIKRYAHSNSDKEFKIVYYDVEEPLINILTPLLGINLSWNFLNGCALNNELDICSMSTTELSLFRECIKDSLQPFIGFHPEFPVIEKGVDQLKYKMERTGAKLEEML
jgi:hypothetical protein